jgi:hypothetical protein
MFFPAYIVLAMTAKQRKRINEYTAKYSKLKAITPGIKSLIYSLVCIEIEEEELQSFIDDNGTCYTAPSGFDKQRPQWQQLRDNRQRKTAIVSRLEAQITAEDEQEDELELLLQSKEDV